MGAPWQGDQICAQQCKTSSMALIPMPLAQAKVGNSPPASVSSSGSNCAGTPLADNQIHQIYLGF
jgi:hypothetical protein